MAHPVHLARHLATQRLSQLDPAIVGFGLARLRAEEDDTIALAVEDPDRVGDMPHEGLILADEMIGGQDSHHGVRVPGEDPVRGQEDGRGRAPVSGLLEHVGRGSLVP